MRCSELLAQYLAELPLGVVLSAEQATRHLKAAVRFYCGYATLTGAPSAYEVARDEARAVRADSERFVQGLDLAYFWPAHSRPGAPLVPDEQRFWSGGKGLSVHSPVDASNGFAGDQDFDLTVSEYALIWPLFLLYVERENAMALESSRSSGMDHYGRTVSEVQNEIQQAEDRMASLAFEYEVITV